MSFNMIRRIMFDCCKKADRIIMAIPEGDFESLRIPPEDYNLLLPKIRDVGKIFIKLRELILKGASEGER